MSGVPTGALRRTDAAGVATITFDHPPINLLERPLILAMGELVAALEADAQTKVVVFRSANPDYFVNHYDISGRSSDLPPDAHVPALFRRIARLPQITLGEIRGRTRGAGSELALALDMRFAAIENAIFGQPEVGLGLHPGAGATQRLPELVGRGRALEIMLSGDDFDAQTAERFGWIYRALPDADLSMFVDRLAQRIASFPTLALRNIKELVNLASLPTDNRLTDETQRFVQALREPETGARIRWLFANGAQTDGPLERDLGTRLSDIPTNFPQGSPKEN